VVKGRHALPSLCGRCGLVTALCLVVLLCWMPATAEGWWGTTATTSGSTSVPVTKLIEQGVEMMADQLHQFSELLERFLQARERWADPSKSASSFVGKEERLFQKQKHQHQHATALALRTARRGSGDSNNCNSPYGASHPVCSPSFSCAILKMTCEGKVVNVKTFSGSLERCVVNEVRCTNGPVPSLTKRQCAPHQMECAGGRVAAVDAPPGAAASCNVSQLMCANMTLLTFDPSTSACDDQPPKCESVCEKAGYVCSCSLDRIGDSCEKWRPYTCTFRLLSPQPSCRPIPQMVSGDPVCFVYRREQSVTFEYTIDCSFDKDKKGKEKNKIQPPVGNFALSEFDYFVCTEKFAVSRAQAALWPFEAQLKVFDFTWISDRSATQMANLSAAQLGGNESISFTLAFDKIPDRFFAGDRIYFEFGLSRASNIPERTIKYDRRFIDFEGLNIQRSANTGLSAVQISWLIAFLVVCLVCMVGLSYWGWGKFQACRHPKEHDL